MVERRLSGEPLQYALGSWGFRRLDLLVDSRTLIPRPETEIVVEEAMREAARVRPAGGLVAVDLGTGSGAIALSLAVELAPPIEVWATDRSDDALAVARANLAGLGGFAATHVQMAAGDWFDALPSDLKGSVHLVVSNPPYVADHENLPAEVADWEPHDALFAGPTGLEAIDAIVGGAPSWLATPGTLVVELAPHQAVEAAALALAAGFGEVEIKPDLAGRDRVLIARQ
jgi:release factor glutamine methyltransferase